MEYDDDPQPAGPRSDVWETSEEPAPGYRHPWFVEEDREPLESGSPFGRPGDAQRARLFDAEGFPVILFDPVPLLRRRKKAWDENRQRAYISMLAQRVPVRMAPSHPKSPLPSPTRAASRP